MQMECQWFAQESDILDIKNKLTTKCLTFVISIQEIEYFNHKFTSLLIKKL